MDLMPHRAHIPVILLYNLDRSWPQEDIEYTLQVASQFADGLAHEGHPIQVVRLQNGDDLNWLLSDFDPQKWLVFNWCEEIPGQPRSDVQVAKILAEMGFTFTGADADGLDFSQHKPSIKETLHQAAIPTPYWQVLSPDRPDLSWERYPAIVKPTREHCSMGITPEAVVQSPSELIARIQYISDTFAQPALVEEYIDGREFHVGLLGNGHIQMLPPAEMDFAAFNDIHDRICTYESKFNPKSPAYNLIQLQLPAALDEYEMQRLQTIAQSTYQATGCRDYARLDLRLSDSEFYVLDVNHNADLCPDTSLVLAAQLAGYDYGRLGSMIVSLAAHRHALMNQESG